MQRSAAIAGEELSDFQSDAAGLSGKQGELVRMFLR
jgi:hypothetical protein